LFLSHVISLLAVPFAASLVSFPCRQLSGRAACCIACVILLRTSCPPRCSLNRSFLPIAFVLQDALLAASLVSFDRRHLARRALRGIAHLTPRHSLHHFFFSLVDVLPTAALAVILEKSEEEMSEKV
jgi:hypothetical protein